MVGSSSEGGYLNIGIAETSSHLEIEPKIEAKAIGDFDEVCGLEKKECDDIMEHLKNNPGLVVKSSGLDGQIVLHVAVIAGKTKKSKPPTSKCTDKKLREATNDSDWYLALKKQDCKALMSLLKANPCLVAQTGPEGWTVLHATAQRGCLELLDQVFDLFKDKLMVGFEDEEMVGYEDKEMVGFEDERQFVDEPSRINICLKDLCVAKCGKFEAKPADMAMFTCSARVWKRLIDGRRYDESFSSMQRSSSNASQHFRGIN